MKFKSDIEVQAGLKDSAGSSGNGGSILSSTSTGVTWIDNYADWTSVLKQTVKNDGVAVIPKGAPVYITGSDGTNMLVGLAGNATEATSSKTLGLMQTQLATSGSTSTGFVVTEGLLQGLNTAGRTAGEPIWLGPNGTLIYGLTNKPYAPAHLVFIGIVTKISSGNGEVFVKVQNGFELKEIHDVDIVTDVPINGDILGYNGTLWVNKTIAEWLGFTPANDASVVHLSGTETITGQKTFTTEARTIFQNSDAAQITFKNTSDLTKTLNIGHGSNGNIFSSTGLDFRVGGLTSSALLILANENATFKENLTAKSFIKSGGTSSQFLKADGSIDSTTYQTALTNPVTGTGTTNYIPKFTGASAIGNSLIYDNGTNVGIGTTSPGGKLHVVGEGIFDDGTNGRLTFANASSQNDIYSTTTSFGGWKNLRLSSNELILSSGGTTERMRITSGGNVGIGTTSPSTKLDVNGDINSGATIYSNSFNFRSDNFKTSAATVGKFSTLNQGATDFELIFNRSANGSGAYYSIQSVEQGVAYRNLLFQKDGGNVGIGTTSPINYTNKTNLAIQGAWGGQLDIMVGSTSHAQFGSDNYDSGLSARIQSADGIVFKVNGGTLAATITSDGNVGIGTTSPAYKLDAFLTTGTGSQVVGRFFGGTNSNGNAGGITLGTTQTQAGYVFGEQTASNEGSLVFGTQTSGSYAERMRITSGGNVGIGTTSPSEKLVVANGKLFLTEADPTIGGKIYGYNDTSTQLYEGGLKFQSRYYDGSNYVFADRLTIKGNGNVGIGTTSPEVKLDLLGTGTVQSRVQSTSGGDIRFSVDTVGRIGTYSSSDLLLLTSGTERMRITSGGNVGIGTTNPTRAFHVIGGDGGLGTHIAQFEGRSGVVGMYVRGDGNVGIGNTSPSEKLVVSGNVVATGFFNSSDIRLKDLIDYEYNVDSIKPITYTWKDSEDKTKKIGYSAQEVQKVLPDAVSENNEGFLSVDYIQVLVAKIAELENRIKKLEK